MRGHRRLRMSGQLGSIENVCAKLLQAPPATHTPVYSRMIFGAAMNHAELVVRQYLYLRLVFSKLPRKLLIQAGSVDQAIIYPLPHTWQDILIEHGFSVNKRLSSALWFGFVVALWVYGAAVIIRLLALTFFARFTQRYKHVSNFAHFESITKAQTPRANADGRSHDVMSWYMQWDGRAPDVDTLTYRVVSRTGHDEDHSIVSLTTPAVPTITLRSWCRFAGWGLAAVFLALFDIVRGRWWHSVLLNQAAFGALIRHVEKQALADDYLSNNSGWFYRPLWTYDAEDRGSRIIFYHYSTNSARARTNTGYPPEHHSWSNSNWPLHLVWNDYHADFVKRATGEDNTQVVGPIWFSSTPESLPDFPSHSIAVFDVTPFRPSKFSEFADEFIYYTADTCNAFVSDVAKACAEVGFQMVWKRKRNIGKIAHPKYRQLLETLERDPDILVLSTDHAPVRLIESCEAVISLPFTSTALIGREKGKPSCYYDPNGSWQKTDRAAHDIPLVQGYDELVAWVRALDSSVQSLETGNRGATKQ